ncbi:MAG: amidohydrolase family protein [Clostridia bacterium]|nr:amidohydrolase family protein [Clostridia bacterium]
MINEKIIDTHLHVEGWQDSEGTFIDCFERYREEMGLYAINLCVVPTVQRNVCNNIMCALYKLAHPRTYAHAGVDHISWPISENMPEGMDLVTQYRELMEIGFDGIKMLEGKPSHHKRNGGDLSTPPLARLFAEIEKDGTHLLLHSNDPEEFWHENMKSQVKEGWWYGDGTYASHEEIYAQTEKVLENHPNIKVTLAHFYFCGKRPERLEALFEKYPNLCVDITQGGEMYHAFEANQEYFKDFFIRYSDRILLGTDSTYPWGTNVYNWLIDRTYRFVATNDKMSGFGDKELTGINLPKNSRENILWRNFERRVGAEPRLINKGALKAYYEKYKHLLTQDEAEQIKPYIEKFL